MQTKYKQQNHFSPVKCLSASRIAFVCFKTDRNVSVSDQTNEQSDEDLF